MSTQTNPKKSHRIHIALAIVGVVVLLPLVCGWCWIAEMNIRGGSPTNIAVAPDGTLYVSDPGRGGQMLFTAVPGGCVWVIDSQKDRLRGVIKTDADSGIAVAPNGKVYLFPIVAGGRDYDTIQVVDKGAWRTSRVLPITDVRCTSNILCHNREAFFPVDRFVDGDFRDGIEVIDTDTDQIVQRIPVTTFVEDMVALGDEKAYATGWEGHIWVFNTKAHVVTGEVTDTPRYDYEHIILAPNGKVYVTYYHERKRGVLVVDPETDRAIGQITVPSDYIVGMTVVPDGRIYLLHTSGEMECRECLYYISVIEPEAGRVTKTIPLPPESRGLGSGPYYRMVMANGKVYVVHGFHAHLRYDLDPCARDREIYVIVIDPKTDQIVRTIPLQRPWLVRLFPY